MKTGEKPTSNFENIIAHEVGSLDGVVDAPEGMEVASEKVSEVVGENASENIPQSRGKKSQPASTTKSKADKSIAQDIKLVLPTPQKQKAELKKVITKRTNELVREVTKLQKSKNYSPAKVEALIEEIRQLRQILAELVNATMERLEDLYRRYVWRH